MSTTPNPQNGEGITPLPVPGQTGTDDPCADTWIQICSPISEEPVEPTSIEFYSDVESTNRTWSSPDGATIELACNRIEAVNVTGRARLRISQEWYLNEMVRGDVASVVSLGPLETLTLRVTRSQRTRLDNNTMSSKESLRSNQSRIADKEMVEVARTTTKNEQWQVGVSASVQAGPANIQASAGYQQSVGRQMGTKLQQVREATQKASADLRALNKVEVVESTGQQREDEQIHRIENPYRDRSLNLTFFELNKVFCVKYDVASVEPFLAISAPRFHFDSGFVLANADFLAKELVDRALLGELNTALAYTESPEELEGVLGRLDRLAYHALEHIFGERTVHFVDRDGVGGYDIGSSSFLRNGDALGHSAWSASSGKPFADETLMLLASFRTMSWNGDFMLLDSPNEEAAYERLDLVVALAAELKLLWEQIDPNHRREIFNQNLLTAVFRRVPAFLTIVDHMIRPHLDEVSRSHGQAEAVMHRIVSHLRCMNEYYSERFHAYLYQMLRGKAHVEMVTTALAGSLGMTIDEQRWVVENFDIEGLSLAGSTIHVPARRGAGEARLAEFFPDEDLLAARPPVARDRVVVPADGVTLEPSVGMCRLDVEAEG